MSLLGVLSHRYGFGFTLLLGILVCFSNLCWICFVMRDPGAAIVPPTPTSLSDNHSRDGMPNGEVTVANTSSISLTAMGNSGNNSGKISGNGGGDDGMSTSDSDNNNHMSTSINRMNSDDSESSLLIRDIDTVVLPVPPHRHLAAQLSIGAARPSEKLAWHPLETFRRLPPLPTPLHSYPMSAYHLTIYYKRVT